MAIDVRFATPADIPFILKLIRELADYEHALAEVKASEELLERWLFTTPKAECLVATLDDQPQGIALFFTNFSTWEAIPGLFLEDLMVREHARGQGLGSALFRKLANIVLERGYTRLEWCCLNWNEPSLKFYHSLGALARTDWIPHRLTLDTIRALAGSQ